MVTVSDRTYRFSRLLPAAERRYFARKTAGALAVRATAKMDSGRVKGLSPEKPLDCIRRSIEMFLNFSFNLDDARLCSIRDPITFEDVRQQQHRPNISA